MTTATTETTTTQLTLPQELILLLLNEEEGYFHQVPGWKLDCVVIGAVIAELSLIGRIDTDLESLILVDSTKTEDPALDPVLEQISFSTQQRDVQFWIERLSPLAEQIIDRTLNGLADMKILDHHDGDYWTLSRASRRGGMLGGLGDDSAAEFVKNRIMRLLFSEEIPDPRDVILVCLVNTCDIFRFIFPIEEEEEARIAQIVQMDVIGRSIAEAVAQEFVSGRGAGGALGRTIPTVSLTKMVFNKHLRNGNIPALFASLIKQYGPVFKIKVPFKDPLVVVGGPRANYWVQKQGRMYLRTRDYFSEIEAVYGASGVLPSLDGGDHFRLRKALQPGYSRGRLGGQLDTLYNNGRNWISRWNLGDKLPLSQSARYMINSQLSELFVGVDTQDILDDLLAYKERALAVLVIQTMPRFMLNTRGMKKKAKAIDRLMERVQGAHTPAQRRGQRRDLVDDYMSLHSSDPQFMPESNLKFSFSAALLASAYLGDMMSFVWYAMAARPELHAKIRAEADALWENGDPTEEKFTPETMDVTHRFMLECMRLYPIVPMSLRNVMNSVVVEGFELEIGTRLHIAQTATHYMEGSFPNPEEFDIDRYLPPRNEHRNTSYAPYGLGTHSCLGQRWMELQMAINVLLLARHFTFEVTPAKYKDNIKLSPFPSMKPHKKVKVRVTEKRLL